MTMMIISSRSSSSSTKEPTGNRPFSATLNTINSNGDNMNSNPRMNNNIGNPSVVVPLQRPNANDYHTIFWAQLHHHRRLRRQRRKIQKQQAASADDGKDVSFVLHSPGQQQQPGTHHLLSRFVAPADSSSSSSSVPGGNVSASVGLSSCHMVLYTGEIAMGTPLQNFTVNFDTGSSVLWLASTQCDATCDEIAHWRKYNTAKSTTHQSIPTSNNNSVFLEEFYSDEYIEGVFGMDVLHLGNNLVVENQTFGMVTSFNEVIVCQGEEGRLGLLFGNKNSVFPTFLDNLKSQLRHPIFSLYLDKTDDYGADPGQPVRDPAKGPGHEFDNGPESDASYRPQSAHSEICFGGVNQHHYVGCLKWYDIVQEEPMSTYWSLQFQRISVGEKELPGGRVAILDSGSTFIEGPLDAVSAFCELNNFQCFLLDEFGGVEDIPCDRPGGFDAAVTLCTSDIKPLVFTTYDGESYKLGADELFMKVETDAGEVCFLRVMESPDIRGWVLGDAFLDRYFTVFDFGKKRIGLALNTNETALAADSFCAEDWSLDILFNGTELPLTAPFVPLVPVSASMKNDAPSPTRVSSPISVSKPVTGSPPARVPAPSGAINMGPSPSLPHYAPTTTVTEPKITSGRTPTSGSSSLSGDHSSGGGSSWSATSIGGVAVAVVVVAVLMVAMISWRRKRRYHRADRYQNGDLDMQEVELPGLL